MTKQDLEAKRNVDFMSVSIDDLVDIRTVKINPDKPIHEKVIDFIQQIQNPYIFKVGEIAVKVNFDENGPSFQEKFQNFLKDCIKN